MRRPWISPLLAAAALLAAGGASVASGPAERSVGVRAPEKPLEARLARLEGGSLRLSSLRGQPVLLDLWASWCVPCREQSRILRDLSDEIAARGIRFYAVDVGERPGAVRDYLAKTPSEVPVLLDRTQALPRLLRIDRLPALLAVRSDGRLAAGRVGLTRRDEILGLLDALAGDGGDE